MRLRTQPSNLSRPFKKIQPAATRTFQLAGLGLVGMLLSIQPALAHHAMENQVPANWAEGLLSGLAHPVIGLDHLAFVVAIGLLAAITQQGMAPILAFLGTAALGTGIHLLGFDLPMPEILIALSVLALGVMLAFSQKLPLPAFLGFAALAGLFHGYAYGESIVGAEATPIAAYLIGFTLIQLVIALIAKVAGEGAMQAAPLWSRLSGGAVGLVGVVFLIQAIAG
jgi:urease accessory protein